MVLDNKYSRPKDVSEHDSVRITLNLPCFLVIAIYAEIVTLMDESQTGFATFKIVYRFCLKMFWLKHFLIAERKFKHAFDNVWRSGAEYFQVVFKKNVFFWIEIYLLTQIQKTCMNMNYVLSEFFSVIPGWDKEETYHYFHFCCISMTHNK